MEVNCRAALTQVEAHILCKHAYLYLRQYMNPDAARRTSTPRYYRVVYDQFWSELFNHEVEGFPA